MASAADIVKKHGKWAKLYAANEKHRFAHFSFNGAELDMIEEAIRLAVLEGVRVGMKTERGE